MDQIKGINFSDRSLQEFQSCSYYHHDMRKLSIAIALTLVLTGCGSSESADGSRDAGDCTTLGEIIESNGEMAICVKVNNANKYLIAGPAMDDIKLLAGIKSFAFYLSDEGQAMADDLGWSYQDFDNIDYDILNLKRYIADKPEWKDVAGLILADEKAAQEMDYVFKNYCPKDPEAYCAPKTMSEEGNVQYDRAQELVDIADRALNEKLELIGVALEGQYQVDGLKAAEFAMKSLKIPAN